MLREEVGLSTESRQLMDIVIRETDRLNTIITEFLDYARPKTAHQVMISLASLLQETTVLFRNSPEFREGISVDCSVDPTLDVMGDPQRLRQVFWNLLINAAQAISQQGTISIQAAPDHRADAGSDMLITIADSGSGIDPANIDKIFDPFFTTKTHGTGLGLAIAYRIIDDHGGSISVESGPGIGTKFKIRLPVSAVPSALPQEAS
jgi:two-component system sensor histidine kinase PilS (NtrC family)